MGYIDLCLIADHNTDRRNGLKQTISKKSLAKEVVGSLNCGHGLLYLNQTIERFKGKNAVIILNGKTPMMCGFEFLNEFNKTDFKREASNVKIVLLMDGLSAEEVKKFKSIGVSNFIEGHHDEDELLAKLRAIFRKPTVRKPYVKTEKLDTDQNEETEDDSFQDLESNQVFFIPKTNVG